MPKTSVQCKGTFLQSRKTEKKMDNLVTPRSAVKYTTDYAMEPRDLGLFVRFIMQMIYWQLGCVGHFVTRCNRPSDKSV